MNSNRQTGDVMLNGSVATPVEINGAENVHIQSGSVDGDLILDDVEFVFTGQESDTEAVLDTEISALTETKFYGPQMEDAYVQNSNGDVIITEADDVFIEPDAVTGDILVIGAEQQFHQETPSVSHANAEASVVGWKQNISETNPNSEIIALGSKCTVTVNKIREHAEVYVTGWENTIYLDGRGDVTVTVIGSHNEIEVGGLLDAEINKIGVENVVRKEDFPVEELIEQRKSEAFTNAGFGKDTVTYQEPTTTDDGKCPVCMADADAIIERTTVEAFFLFGHPVYQYGDKTTYNECEECSDVSTTEVELTEADRQQIL